VEYNLKRQARDSRDNGRKLSFEVNVAETEPNSDGSPADYRHVKVLLNPEEHQKFAWLKKEEVEECRCGDMDFKFARPTDTTVMLQAFKMREKYKSEMDE